MSIGQRTSNGVSAQSLITCQSEEKCSKSSNTNGALHWLSIFQTSTNVRTLGEHLGANKVCRQHQPRMWITASKGSSNDSHVKEWVHPISIHGQQVVINAMGT